MKLPVDVKAVIDEAMDIDAARNTPLSVSVLIDDTAPADIVAHVRNIFASAAAHARITVGYINGSAFAPNPDDDMAVIVAGFDKNAGQCAAQLREAGVPVLVATTLPDQVAQLAEENGFAIPDGDLVAPELSDEDKKRAQEAFEAILGSVAPAAQTEQESAAEDAAEEPAEEEPASAAAIAASPLDRLSALRNKAKNIDLGKLFKKPEEEQKEEPAAPELLAAERLQAFDNRMGEWIIEACANKRLSFALAFPFVARPLSLEAINATAVQNAGIGVVVFLPGADMPLMTLNQAKMMLQIAAAYGQEMSIERAKELVVLVGGAFACRSVARSAAGAVPFLGWAVKGVVGYTGTLAMGHAALEYFENGGGVGGLTGALLKVKDSAVKTVSTALQDSPEALPAGAVQTLAGDDNAAKVQVIGGVAKAVASTAKTTAIPLAKDLAQGVAGSFAAGVKSMIK